MLRATLICSVLLLAELLLVTLLAPIGWIEAQMSREYQLSRDILGERAATLVQTTASRAFATLFDDTGLRAALDRLIVPTAEERTRSVGLEDLGSPLFDWAETRLQVLWETVYQGLYRLVLLRSTLTDVLLLVAASSFDGLMVRKVKQHTFGYASPVRFNAGIRSFSLLAYAIPVYVLLPVAMTPVILAGWMILAALCAFLLTSNLQKRI